MSNRRIIILEDDLGVVTALKLFLSTLNYDVLAVTQADQLFELLKTAPCDLLISDLNFSADTTSGAEGIATIERLRSEGFDAPILVMTGWATIDIAIAAMRAGADDFVQKPFDNAQIELSVSRLLQQADDRQRVRQAKAVVTAERNEQSDQCWVANSPAMQQLEKTIAKIAQTDISVLILGENGTGKSALAERIHQQSLRADRELVSVNLGALSESLFESEMFGHTKGAFTDAKQSRIGRFEMADQGTLFLDEVGTLPASKQSALLRVLESQQFEAVGSNVTKRSDCRVIAATNASLDSMVVQGQFRQDLLFRLQGVVIEMPSLRDRVDDIVPIAEQNIAEAAQKYGLPAPSLSEAAIRQLVEYEWPGNIRELKQAIERAVVLCDGVIEPFDLGLSSVLLPAKASTTPSEQRQASAIGKTLEQIEIDAIEQYMQHYEGNALKVAKALGLSRSAFYRRLEKHDL